MTEEDERKLKKLLQKKKREEVKIKNKLEREMSKSCKKRWGKSVKEIDEIVKEYEKNINHNRVISNESYL